MSKTKEVVFPACNDSRGWCNARHDGKCYILVETYEKDGACPFYKKIEPEGYKVNVKHKK